MHMNGKSGFFALVLLLLALCLTACTEQTVPVPAPAAAQSGQDDAGSSEEPVQSLQPDPVAEVQLQLEYTLHPAYMFGQNGFFFPDRALTRAETAQVLVYVFDPAENVQADYTDVAEDSWFFPCVTAVAGLLPGDADGAFRPYDAITLSEFAAAICRGTGCRLPQGSAADVLPDAAVHYAALFGWIDGTASGDQNVTRARAVQILNRALGRTPDRTAIDALDERVFLDVSPGHEA